MPTDAALEIRGIRTPIRAPVRRARDMAPRRSCGLPAVSTSHGKTRTHFAWTPTTAYRHACSNSGQRRPASRPDRGHSVAEWQGAPGGGGGLKVVTDNLIAGYIRKNGAPFSDQTVVTEYYDLHSMPNGDQWLSVTTTVDDPVYFSRPLYTTTDFKKLPDDQGWNPTPCSAR